MAALADIEARLKEPFRLDDIDFLPKGKVEREGKTFCMALPYADPRVYQDRLNAIAYGEWSTPPPVVTVAGNKLICYVTVILCGVPHTDVGEATNNEENTGTEAWAQAFKRACSQFGLGRYLYDLEKEWVPFDVKRKQIDLDKASRRAVVRKMYQKAGIALPGQGQSSEKLETSPAQAKSVTPLQSVNSSANTEQTTHPAVPESHREPTSTGMATEQQKDDIRDLCLKLGRKSVPVNLDRMSFDNASNYITGLSAQLLARQNKAS